MKEKQTIKLPLTYPVKTGYKPDWIDFTIPEEVYDKAMNADRVKEMLKDGLLKVYLDHSNFIPYFAADPSSSIGTVMEINDDNVLIEFNEDNCMGISIDMLKDCTVSSFWLAHADSQRVIKDGLKFIGYYLCRNSYGVTIKDGKLEDIIPNNIEESREVLNGEEKE